MIWNSLTERRIEFEFKWIISCRIAVFPLPLPPWITNPLTWEYDEREECESVKEIALRRLVTVWLNWGERRVCCCCLIEKWKWVDEVIIPGDWNDDWIVPWRNVWFKGIRRFVDDEIGQFA